MTLVAQRESLLGVVLCGGASRRMGRDKACERLAGRTLLQHALDALLEVTPSVVLATGSEPRYAEHGLPCVLDRGPRLGPLAGLEAGLRHARELDADTVCVLACDMPRVTPEIFEALLERLEEQDADACLLAGPDGLEPLCAVYRTRVLPAVERALERGERRLVAFHGEARVARLELDAGDVARNLNTPDELASERSRGGGPR